MLAKKALSATAGAPKLYVEDVMSCFLYTGTGSAQTITNNIDLSTEGGLVWLKSRSQAYTHLLYDTARGTSKDLRTNSTNAQADNPGDGLSAFNSNGFSIPNTAWANINESNTTYVSWTFRKAKKFFDVVTYTGTGSARTINHNLGSVPGCIIVKRTNLTGNWGVYHRSLGATKYIYLNGNNTSFTDSDFWNDTEPTSTNFTVGISSVTNNSGDTYVAYLFAHDAGGFGDAGDQNVISCGSFTTDGGGNIPTVNLGYEPQWILAKPSSGAGNWFIMDNMRGWYNQQADQGNALFPNTSGAEGVGYNAMIPTATGFTGPNLNFGAGITYIYIAIRRGPMKTPEAGTSVFSPNTTSPVNVGFTADMYIGRELRSSSGYGQLVLDRLRGGGNYLYTNSGAAEAYIGNTVDYTVQYQNNQINLNYGNNTPLVTWAFGRAPGFFDVVCYTGNRTSGSSTTQAVTHNLGVAPELLIVKSRSNAYGWFVYSSILGASNYLSLTSTIGSTSAANPNGYWNETAPTSTQFTVGANNNVNGSAVTFVAYLFASCPGVSKVGSYTGTGTTLQVNCGFTGGARFVLIKRTDSTGDWYVWDTARGIVSGNDPYLLLNSTAAEVTNTDYIDTYSAGFEISSTAPAAINANGGTFIYLAIA